MKKASPKGRKPIRALTIRQPWAELILRRRKCYELRSWSTKYCGPLIIHAGSRVDRRQAKELGLNPDHLPTSQFVGVVHVVGVERYTRKHHRILKARRATVGGWSSGQFAWILKRPRRLPIPTKAIGSLNFFRVPPRVDRQVAKLLRRSS